MTLKLFRARLITYLRMHCALSFQRLVISRQPMRLNQSSVDSSPSEDAKKESKLPGSFLPAAAVVKSAEQVEEERRKKDEAEGKSAPEPKARPIGPKQIGPQPVAKPTDEVTDSVKSTPPSSIEKPLFCSRCCPRMPF